MALCEEAKLTLRKS